VDLLREVWMQLTWQGPVIQQVQLAHTGTREISKKTTLCSGQPWPQTTFCNSPSQPKQTRGTGFGESMWQEHLVIR
jgi:hypothetical protein